MAKDENKINIKSVLSQEVHLIHWKIQNFGMIPFRNDNPVRSSPFLLKKHKDIAWSLLMSKQEHEGVKNVGFKLVRTEDEEVWDSVTVSLSVVMADGRIFKCIDKEALGGESQNRYVFLIRPLKSKRTQENEMDASTQVEFSQGLEGSVTKSKALTICDHDGFIEDGKVCSFKDAKKCNEKDVISKPDLLCGSPKDESSSCLNPLPKKESSRIEDSEVKTRKVKKDGTALTPEELLKLKDLTVECVIEYTYMKYNKVEKSREESIGKDLMAVFKHLDDTEIFSDITLKCKDVSFPCHKGVLSPLSSVFEKLLRTEGLPNPVTINLHMPLHIAKAFIMYMYTREFPDRISVDDCKQLSNIAEHFGVEGMQYSCQVLKRYLQEETSKCLKCLESSTEEAEPEDVRMDDVPKLLYSIVT